LALATGSDGCATSTELDVTSCVSGVKSATGSYGSLGYSVALIVWLVNETSRLLPSGGDLATVSAAMLPPAPDLFSTITLRPSSRPISGASSRAIVSVLPPGGVPTHSRIGAFDCARSSAGAAASASTERLCNFNHIIDLTVPDTLA
jgi:hypothetical protein